MAEMKHTLKQGEGVQHDCCAPVETPVVVQQPLVQLGRRAPVEPPPISQSHQHTAVAAASEQNAEEAQERAYRGLMRKFWFAACVGLPLLLLMLAEFVPAWNHALMGWQQSLGLFIALLTLPVLVWSGGQFFASAWHGLLRHNTNMDTLVALGTG
ncbi:MAG: cation-translocating P-type ATPase, partial [Acidobacteria bacterium]|nr:cation-translocating P-type ATPase [Acidobacteriota bacterium]